MPNSKLITFLKISVILVLLGRAYQFIFFSAPFISLYYYAEYFKQAIEIEGTFKTQGKHAAGVVISKEPLQTVCPMVKQKGSTEKIAGLEMTDLEALGHVKFDVLGINLLDKLMKIKELNNGK